MGVMIDDRARRAIGRRRPGWALLLTIVTNYGLPNETLSVEWCSQREAEHDPTVVAMDDDSGVPIYVHERLAAYARWRGIGVTAKGLPWWPRLAISGEETTLRDLLRWERVHPGLRSLAQVTAA